MKTTVMAKETLADKPSSMPENKKISPCGGRLISDCVLKRMDASPARGSTV